VTDVDFSFLPLNSTYQNQFARLCKEHREPESINNLQFTLAEFACSNSLAFFMRVLATKSNEILPITMRFQKGLQTVSAKELP